MAIDQLQEKIRKQKNPCMVDFTVAKEHIPAHILTQERDFTHAYGRFCLELLEGLAGKLPGVRFSFACFAALGSEGLILLTKLLDSAKNLGYYVLLDMPEALSALAAGHIAQRVNSEDSPWYCDGILTSAYIGTDAIHSYLSCMENNQKDLFVVLRTSNRTAPQLQDLLTGGRLAYMSMADQLNRLADKLVTRCGYSRLAAVGAASSVDCLRALRTKHKTMFLLLDGSDYPNANMKNCSAAFDQLGRGAVACVGLSVTAAWQTEGTDGTDYVEAACRSVDRIKKNLSRYITVL